MYIRVYSHVNICAHKIIMQTLKYNYISFQK